VNEDDLRKLEAAGTEFSFDSGQVLIERGEPGAGLYLIREGQVVVEATDGQFEFGPGSVVGERALLADEGVRQARVRALTDCVVVAVGRAEIDRLCVGDPAFADRLSRAS
jgi:CRP-like cAMP-binding protein